MKAKSTKKPTRKRLRVTVAQAFGPDPLGLKRTAAPTAEEDVLAEQVRRAVVGKQAIPGRRRRRRKSESDRIKLAIAKREREIGTLKRALALLEAGSKRKPKRASLLAMGMDLQRP